MKQQAYRILWLLTGMVLLPLAIFAQFSPPGPGSQGLFKLRNRQSGQVLEVGGGANVILLPGCTANQFTDLNHANQQWQIECMNPSASPSNYYYRLITRGTGMVLEAGNPFSPGTATSQIVYAGLARQHWRIAPASSGYWVISNVESGLALQISASGNGIAIHAPYTGGDDQQWGLEEATPNTAAYTMLNFGNFKSATLYSADYAPNTPLVSEDYHVEPTTNIGYAHQQWQLAYVGSSSDLYGPGTNLGEYIMENRKTLEVMTATGNAVMDPVVLNPKNVTNPYQRWVAWYSGGLYYFRNVGSGLFLSINPSVVGEPLAQSFNTQHYEQWQINYQTSNRSVATVAALAQPEPSRVQPALSLYPNPATRTLSLSFSDHQSEPTAVTVTDMRGGRTTSHYQGNGNVDVADLAPGLYIVTVTVGQQQYRQKFVKE